MSPLNIINVCGIVPLKVVVSPPSSVPNSMVNCFSHSPWTFHCSSSLPLVRSAAVATNIDSYNSSALIWRR